MPPILSLEALLIYNHPTDSASDGIDSSTGTNFPLITIYLSFVLHEGVYPENSVVKGEIRSNYSGIALLATPH